MFVFQWWKNAAGMSQNGNEMKRRITVAEFKEWLVDEAARLAIEGNPRDEVARSAAYEVRNLAIFAQNFPRFSYA